MPIVKPFAALRPHTQYAHQIASLPYDVVSEKEAREVFKKNPLTFFRIGRPEIHFPEGPDLDIYSEKVYLKAKEVIEQYISQQIFIQESSPCFYIYRQTMGEFSQTGLVALVSVEDYEKDIIKKHELTRVDKEKDRVNHIIYTQTHAEPVFLAYRDNPHIHLSLQSYLETHSPLYNFQTEDGVGNIVWKIEDKSLLFMLETAFREEVDFLYIADGHHRAKASYLAASEFQKKGLKEGDLFMAVLFPASQLRILPYHRVVKTSLSFSTIVEKSKQYFDIQETDFQEVKEKNCFLLYTEGKSYLFRFKGKLPDDPAERLEVALLQNFLLSPILGIDNPRTDKNIDFVGGIRGIDYIKKLVDEKEFQIGFIMPAVKIEDLFTISDLGKIMPPKSTWFEPKLKSGLFMHRVG